MCPSLDGQQLLAIWRQPPGIGLSPAYGSPFTMAKLKRKSSDADIVTTTAGTIGKLVPGCLTTKLADSRKGRKEVAMTNCRKKVPTDISRLVNNGGEPKKSVDQSAEQFNSAVPEVYEPPKQDVGEMQSGTSAGNTASLSPNGLAALDYARRGLWVFPLHPGRKCPTAGSRGWKDATCNEAQIRRWWEQDPRYGVAIATGNGIVVLDIDSSIRGQASLKKLIGLLGELPPTVEVRTPGKGGGSHRYFQTGGRALSCHARVADSLDVRGEKGYVVAPPSLHLQQGCTGCLPATTYDLRNVHLGVVEGDQMRNAAKEMKKSF